MVQTNIISAAASLHKGTEDSIGAILVKAGRLKPEDVERILRLQRERGLRFGEAAKALRLLSQADIDFVLSRQFDYAHLQYGESRLNKMVVAAHAPYDAPAEALRAVRSELMLRWFDDDVRHKTLAVISAARQEGRSFIAANLAVVFSQLGERTLLIDGDMRCPCQHELFGLENQTGLSTMLSARIGHEALQRVSGLPRLCVLPTGARPPNPLELLSRPAFPLLLQDLTRDYDVIILDTPPAACYADAQTVAARAGAALIVARQNLSRISQVRGVSDAAARAGAALLGTVLNDV
jgi:chain length determinant protein tyrosine kinase EpsG